MVTSLGYTRVSSGGQLQGTGLDRQSEIIHDFAEKKKFSIDKIFHEKGISGTIEQRPAFSEMIGIAKNESIKIIIIEDMTRLARELMLQMHMASYIASQKIDLWSAVTGENISEALMEDPMRKALIQMQGVFAELERSTLMKRLNKGKKIIKETGKKGDKVFSTLTREGTIKVEGGPRLSQLCPDLVPLIRDFDSKGFSQHQIAKELNNLKKTNSKGGKISQQQVRRILEDIKLELV